MPASGARLPKSDLAEASALIAEARYADAEDLLWRVLEAQPRRHEAMYLLSMLALQFKKHDLAERLIREAITLDPGQAAYHAVLGRAHRGQGSHDQAESCFRRVIRMGAKTPDAHVFLGLSLKAQGRTSEAVKCYRLALKSKPDYAEAKINLANALRELGQADEASALYAEAAREAPGLAAAQSSLAASLVTNGYTDEAFEQYRRALALDPHQPSLQFMVGWILHDKGNRAEAIESYRRAVEQNPRFAPAWVNLGLALREAGRAREAVDAYHRAIEAEPEHLEAHVNLGVALAEFGGVRESIALLERARDLRPDSAAVLTNLGASLVLESRVAEAEAVLRRALELDPSASQPRVNLGMALRGPGRQQEAIALLREAIALDPANDDAYQNLQLGLNYADGVSPGEIVEAARSIAAAPLAKPRARECAAVDRAGRRLRIGYVSPDLRKHSVAYFLEPVLSNHDRDRFEVFCYHLYAAEDEVTQRLRGHADRWTNAFAIPTDVLAQRIREDGVDVLVDLSGHTAHNRLGLYAYRPAPVQIAWLGFPSTLGIPSIDYRITDWQVDPSGYERFNTETPLRLPDSYFCYRPGPAPDVGPLPALSQGQVTFGSFNNLAKITDMALQLWAAALAAVPASRLIVKSNALAEAATRERLQRAFSLAGVAPARVELLGWEADSASHLQVYNRVDIALDSFPYNGATTTCEALWMGVPVVSLSGPTHASRMGRSILGAAGLPHLAADDAGGFQAIAVRLAADLPALAALRAGLRDRLRASALMDESRFTRALESIYSAALPRSPAV